MFLSSLKSCQRLNWWQRCANWKHLKYQSMLNSLWLVVPLGRWSYSSWLYLLLHSFSSNCFWSLWIMGAPPPSDTTLILMASFLLPLSVLKHGSTSNDFSSKSSFALSYFSLRQTMVVDILCELCHHLQVSQPLFGGGAVKASHNNTLALPDWKSVKFKSRLRAPLMDSSKPVSCQVGTKCLFLSAVSTWQMALRCLTTLATIFWQRPHHHQLVIDLAHPVQLQSPCLFYEGQGQHDFITDYTLSH